MKTISSYGYEYLLMVLVLLLCACRREEAVQKTQTLSASPVEELSLGDDMQDEKVDEPARMEQRVNTVLPPDAGLDELMEQLEQLEREAEFTAAWQMARDYRAAHAGQNGVAELDKRIDRLNRLRREAPDMLYAFQQLEDANPTVRDVAGRQLLHGGETARIILRKALRKGPEAVAVSAADILDRMGDHAAFADLTERITVDGHEKAQKLLPLGVRMISSQDKIGLVLAVDMLEKTDRPVYAGWAQSVYLRLAELDTDAQTATLHERVGTYIQRAWKAAGDINAWTALVRAAVAGGEPSLIQGMEAISADVRLAFDTDDPGFDSVSGRTIAKAQGNTAKARGVSGNALALQDADARLVADPPLEIGNAWTLSCWFTLPLPPQQWYTLVRGTHTDHHVISDSSGNLGVYLNGRGDFHSSGYNLQSLPDGWHHLVAVAQKGRTVFYINGKRVAECPVMSAADIAGIGNFHAGT